MARALAAWSARAYVATTVSDRATDAQAYVTLDEEGDIIVAFRGSKTPQDFLQDAKFEQVMLAEIPHGAEDPLVMVHEGFLEDFDAITVTLISQVRTYLALKPLAKIYITGHSLGGALAILCALEFSQQLLMPELVVTFGQPRVGNAAFRDLYNAALLNRTFRVINQNDIVPRTPGALLGYRHCGQEVFLRPDGQVEFNPAIAEKIIWDAVGLYGAYRRLEDVLIRDHFIQQYQERIQGL